MDFELFFGRFHPLVVHLPIGFIFLAAILEVLNRLYKDKFFNLDTTISITLFCAGIGSVLSAFVGYLLSSGGGYDEQTLFWHQWLGIGLSVFAFFGWAVKVGRIKMSKNSTSVIIGLLVVFISIIGHLGGNLTHGSDYLLTYAPSFVQKIAGVDSERNSMGNIPSQPDSIIVFQHLVQPVLDAKCIGCHNETKAKGGLKLTSFEGVEEGGDHGHAIVSGSSNESILFLRTTLPQNGKKFMPTKGEPLSYSEIKIIQWWIESGANSELRLTEFEVTDEVQQLLMRDFGVDTSPKPYFDRIKVSVISEENSVQLTEAGFEVKPLSSIHNFIEIKSATKEVNAAQIQALTAAKEQITWLNLKGKSIGDNLLKSIGLLTNLTTLELNNNPISDAGVTELTTLKHLEVLNLYGTEVTDDSFVSIKQLPALKRLYLWQTNVTPKGVDKLNKELPGVEIITGMNNITSNNGTNE